MSKWFLATVLVVSASFNFFYIHLMEKAKDRVSVADKEVEDHKKTADQKIIQMIDMTSSLQNAYDEHNRCVRAYKRLHSDFQYNLKILQKCEPAIISCLNKML